MNIEIEKLIPKISIFGGITTNFIEKIIEKSKIITIEENELLYKEDSNPSNLYVIISGKLKLVHGLPDTPFEIVEIAEGESIGGEAFIGIQNYVFSAIAAERTKVLAISGTQIAEFEKEGCKPFTLFILNIARDFARDANRLAHIMIDNFERL